MGVWLTEARTGGTPRRSSRRHEDCAPTAPASAGLERVHERLDEITASISKIQSALDVNIALCKDCRPRVMGNGKESLDIRIARLEEARAVSKSFIVTMVSLAGVAGSLASLVLKMLGI